MKRSPAAAFWLSLLPGLGHFYLGIVTKGFVFALLAVGLIDIVERGADAFGIMIPIYWLFVMLDAHRSAQAINRGVETGETFSKSGSKWWGGALIVLGVLFLLYNFDLFEFDWLWQFWPLALIVIGIRLIKMPLNSVTTPAQPPAVPPSPGSATDETGTDEAGEAGNGSREEETNEGDTHERTPAG